MTRWPILAGVLRRGKEAAMPVAGLASGDAQPAVELADLRLFVVLAEELHFGRAAARLHLSQPGLSYRVKALERALGYQVLARNRRGCG